MLETERGGAVEKAAGPAPGTVVVTRRATFAAAHVLRRPEWDEERNRSVFGACAGDHGHNYQLEVSVAGRPEPETGMVVNLRELDRAMREAVVDRVDHRHLNRDVDFLAGVIPTAENLALSFWAELERCLPEGSLRRVRLVESENNSVQVERA
ncbi:MAG: 6-carboxytetrahydropterin synthase [Candidatus Dormibacterales bacterium]